MVTGLYFLIPILTHSALLGHYKLWDSKGNALYDYSLNERHAEVETNSSDSPIFTDRGQFLHSSNSLKFAKNKYADFPASSKMLLAIWYYPSKEVSNGDLLSISTTHSGSSISISIAWTKGSSSNVKVIYKMSGILTESDTSIIYSQWNFLIFLFYQESGNLMFKLYAGAQNTAASSHSFSGVQIDNKDTSWSIRAKDSGLEGFLYEVLWYDENISDIQSKFSSNVSSKPSVLTTVGDPYITHDSKPCHKNCTDAKQSCNANGNAGCLNDCKIGCYSGCYNYYSSPTCISCPLYCNTCSTSTGQCTACISGLTLSSNSCICNTGKVLVVTSSVPYCVTEVSQCKTYIDKDDCLGCFDGYYLDEDSNKCLICSSSCKTCDDNEEDDCLSCFDGYYLDNNRCLFCSPSCKTCDDNDKDDCLSCFDGYYLDDDICVSDCGNGKYENTSLKECSNCIANCSACLDGSTCTTCSSGYIWDSASSTCKKCDAGKYYSSGSCLNCIANCSACSDGSTCTTCLANYVLNLSNTCVSCSNGTYYSSGSCLNCIANCSICPDGTTCTTCSINYVLNALSNTCELCPSGTYYSSRSCYSCIANCSVCPDGITCTTCSINYVLNLSSNTCELCPSGTYYRSGSCLNCITNCSVCPDGSTCTTCLGNYILSSSSNACEPCPSGTYYYNQACSYCITNCSACSNGSTCTTCSANYVLNSLSNACETCPSGKYYYNQACIDCPNLCTICSGPLYCTDCVSNASLSSDNLCVCISPNTLSSSSCLKPSDFTCSISMNSSSLITLTFNKDLSESLLSTSISLSIGDATYSSPIFSVLETTAHNTYNISLEGLNLSAVSTIQLNFISTIQAADSSILPQPSISLSVPTFFQCPAYCLICHLDSVITICDICNTGYIILSGSPEYTCISSCPNSYYQDTSGLSSKCTPCTNHCTTCNSTVCLECENDYFKLNSDCVTVCGSGYAQNLQTKQCEECPSVLCADCEYVSELGQVECSECIGDNVLVELEGRIICRECEKGYYYEDGECKECKELCKECLSYVECRECVELANILDGECKCAEGYVESGKECVASYFEAELYYLGDGKLKLSFDKELRNTLRSEDISIVLNGVSYTSDQYTLEYQDQYYILTFLQFNTAIVSTVTLHFLNPATLQSTDSSTLSQVSLSLSIPASSSSESDSKPSSSKKASSQSDFLSQDPQAEAIASQGSTATRSLTSIAAVISYSSTASLWNFINTIQLLSVIPLLNVELPVMLFATLVALRGYIPIPNVMMYIIPSKGPEPFYRPMLLGYETSQFFINAGDMFSTLCIIACIYPLLLIVRRYLPERILLSYIGRTVTQFIYDYKWNVFTRFYIESYIEIGISAGLQIYSLQDIDDYHDINTLFNLIFGGIALISIIIMPIALARFIYKNCQKVTENEFMKKWSSLFEEFKSTEGPYESSFYYVYFLLRRLVVIGSFFVLKSRPIVQVIVAAFACWMKFVYVLKCKPFKENAMNKLNITIEMVISCCYSLVIILALDVGESVRNVVQWVIIGLIMFGFVVNMAFMIFNIVRNIIRNILRWRNNRRIQNEPTPEDGRDSFILREFTATDISGIKDNSEIQEL